MLLTGVPLFIASFFVIWFGAGLIIQSVDRISKKLRLSSFAVSFFVLGLLTSIPETAVSFNAVSGGTPEIFVGVLLGGIVVLFLLIIPLLAILGKGVAINSQLSPRNLFLTLVVTAAPAFMVLDQKVTNFEGILLIGFYLVLFYLIQKKHGILDQQQSDVLSLKAYSFIDLIKVAAGIGLVFISSDYIVNQTMVFSEHFQVPAFYISLVVLGLGTNLPELSLAIRAILLGKKDIAFGDYLGSGAANTLLFGFFTLLNDGEVITVNNFFITFTFIAAGLGLFYLFSRSERNISVKEGWVLISIYILFVVYELGKEII